MTFAGKVGYLIGTGRCGTTLFHRLVSEESEVASSHMRNQLVEYFHRYCQWYRLPVDEEGFAATKKLEIEEDLQSCSFSFESSPVLALSVAALFSVSEARFVLLVRNPLDCVASHQKKGWYSSNPVRRNHSLAPFIQPNSEFHHSLGRIIPKDNEYERWEGLTQVGKIAWYWSTLNAACLQQLSMLPGDGYRIQKLEELTFEAYRQLCRFLGFEATLSPERFSAIASERPNASAQSARSHRWSKQEKDEFRRETAEMSDRLGYDVTDDT